jgi:Uma2 family endonuclease
MASLVNEAYLPAVLTVPSMTDSEFANFCAEHSDLHLEMTADGQLIVSPPNYTSTGARNSEIDWQLRGWAKRDGRGIAFDSSTGYVLPNGARRSPDASWTLRSRAAQLSPESQATYWRLCPDFVIELKSNSDRLPVLRQKMDEYLANGASLGWILDPATRSVEIYRPGRPAEILIAPDSVLGEGLVDGFVLNLAEVWNPLS